MRKWKEIGLGDIATFYNGYPFKPTEWSTSGKEIIRIQNLTKGSSQTNYFEGKLSNKYSVTKGDILISWSGSLGIYEWEKEDAWLNQHLFKVVFDKEEVDKSFFKYLISNSLEKLETQVHGATMKHITKKNFDAFPVNLPPLPQQQKIANILDAADALRQNDKALIAKYDKLTQALFLDMFGDPVSNPKRWEIKLVEDVALNEKHSIKAGPFGSSLKKEFYVQEGYKIYGHVFWELLYK
jgi:type I restriction enzyme S subunit